VPESELDIHSRKKLRCLPEIGPAPSRARHHNLDS
jgi:hypothetical protein